MDGKETEKSDAPTLSMASFWWSGRSRLLAAAAGTGATALAGYAALRSPALCSASDGATGRSDPSGLRQLRSTSFKLADHHHGKARVRVLKVQTEGTKHFVQEYSVATKLFSPSYADVFTKESNQGLVATDTQKNTVYVVAKRSTARTPEGFGIDLAHHLLHEYPVLSAVEVEVTSTLWDRVNQSGEQHDHGFVKRGPERALARVRLTRDAPEGPQVVSSIEGLTVLKTTQSGFTNFLRDKYTLLPDVTERCLATEMAVEWRYSKPVSTKKGSGPDYEAVRSAIRAELMRGFYGPPKGGVHSVSLQATIYDMGCLVLSAVPAVSSVSIDTPNIHMLPVQQLKAFGDDFDNDVFIATSEPAGTIHCTVSR